MTPRPPILPRAALRFFLRAETLEEIEGDLLELFHARTSDEGLWRARLRYWHDAATVIGHARRARRADTQHRAVRRGLREATSMTLSTAFTELKQAARVLTRYPGYAAVAALTLALGIGANVAIFTVVNAVLLEPLPYPGSERIVDIQHHGPGLGMPELASSPGLILRYRQHAKTLAAVAGYRTRSLNLADGGTPERVRALAMTPDLLTVLATRPAMGRPFTDADAQAHAPGVAILTHGLWQARFGGDPGVIGRTVRLDGHPAEIVGIMPPGFRFPDTDTRLIVPLQLDPDSGFGAFGLTSLARLAPGATVDAARREIGQLQSRLPEWFPGLTADVLAGFGWSVTVESWRDRVVADVSRTLWILLGTVGFVLLIAGTNVANLFLVRAESRQREMAVRAALGAGRLRLSTTFLAESVVLAALGGAAGVVLAAWATRMLVAYGPPQLPRLHEVRMDPAVLAFAAILTLLSAVVLGLLPALTAGSRSFTSLVRGEGRGQTAGRARHRLRRLLIVTQVATALVLLVGSGLMVRSAARLSAVDPGFRAEGLVTAGVSLGAEPDRARAVTFYHRVLDEMARVPGIESAGAASALPVAPGGLSGSNFALKSGPRPEGAIPSFTMYSAVTGGYFETLGVPLLEGRHPVRADAEQDRSVAWVNETFARQFLGARTIGESVQIEGRWLEIVGVVGDLKTFGLREQAKPMVYMPLTNPSVDLAVMYAVVRTRDASIPLASALRGAVDAVDASVPLTAIRPVEEIVAGARAQTSFTMALLVIAAATALALGIVGLYGVVSYVVAQRTAEIGVRLALGARPEAVRAMVLRQGLLVACAGIVVGLGAAAAATRLMASLLFDVSAHDPATFAIAALILTAVSLAATYVPARRAAAIDPARALRQQG